MHGSLLILVANERPLINIDITLLMNIGIWVLLFLFLKATLWKPMLAVIAAREAGIEGARAEAHRLEKEAKKKRDEFEHKLRAARNEAAAAREQLRAEGARVESEILMEVRNEVAAKLERQRAELAAQREKLRAEVLGVVPVMAADLAGKLLGREVKS